METITLTRATKTYHCFVWDNFPVAEEIDLTNLHDQILDADTEDLILGDDRHIYKVYRVTEFRGSSTRLEDLLKLGWMALSDRYNVAVMLS